MAFLMILGALVLWGGAAAGLMAVGPLFLRTLNMPIWMGIGGAFLFVVGIALSRSKRSRKDRTRVRIDVDTRRK